MTTLVILAALAVGAVIGLVFMAAVAGGGREDAYRAGIAAERRRMLAEALREADEGSYGGTA